jgi:hypothetical protein
MQSEMVFYGMKLKKYLVQTLLIIDMHIGAGVKEVNMAVTLDYSKYQIS